MPTSYSDVAHLLRRAGFAPSPADINALTAFPLATVVDRVLDTTAAPAVVMPPEVTNDSSWWEGYVATVQWWLERMRTTPCPIVEKMVLFWHGHFVSSIDKVGNSRHMWDQLQLFRTAGMGSFVQLTKSMALQPAMLVYLDNALNEAGEPNENFARELMELFTLGVGNYTQADVVESARAWTGYGLSNDGLTHQYRAGRHDNGNKTFLGNTGNWNGPNTIDFIFSGATAAIAARFMAKKIWTFFAYPNPSATVLDALAAAFQAGNFDITTLLRTMFNRPEFYSATAKQGLLRSPIEFVVSAMKYTNIPAADGHPEWWMDDMGQNPLMPPNVAGWKGNEAWITSTAFWRKAQFCRWLTWTANNNDLLAGSNTLSVTTAVQRAFDTFGIDSPTPATRADLEAYVTKERAAHGWGEEVNLISLSMLSPEFARA